MQHWNGHQLCVIDTETTGLDPHWHEIIQICILPLDSDLLPRKDVLPFYVEMKPYHPERIDKKALECNKLDLATICSRGHDAEKVKDLLDDWITKLKLPVTAHGTPKKIVPLGQNYAFDRGFIQQWLGVDLYDLWFHYHFKDTMIAAGFLNDQAAFHAEKVPYSKISLTYLCSTLKIENLRAHDALNDCQATAEVYRRMCLSGLF